MGTSNSNIPDRSSLENKIVESTNSIRFDKSGWYLTEEYEAVLETLKGIRDYYAISTDTVITVAPIGAINSVIKMFARDISDPNLGPDVRDQVADELARFQAYIDDIATEAAMNLYNL